MSNTSRIQNHNGPVVPMFTPDSPSRMAMRPNDLKLNPTPPQGGQWPRGEVIREGFIPARPFPQWRGRRGHYRGPNFRFSKSRCNSAHPFDGPPGGRYSGSVECLNRYANSNNYNYNNNLPDQHRTGRRNRYDSFISYTYHPLGDEYIDDTLITDLDQYKLKEDMDYMPQIRSKLCPLPNAKTNMNKSTLELDMVGVELEPDLKLGAVRGTRASPQAPLSPRSEMPPSSNSTEDAAESPDLPVDDGPESNSSAVRSGNIADYLTLVWDL